MSTKAVSSSFTICQVSHVVGCGRRRTLTLVVAVRSWLDGNLAVTDPKTGRTGRAVLLGDSAEQDVRNGLLASAHVDRAIYVLDHGAGEALLDLLVGGVEMDVGDSDDAAARRLGEVDRSTHPVFVWMMVEQRC